MSAARNRVNGWILGGIAAGILVAGTVALAQQSQIPLPPRGRSEDLVFRVQVNLVLLSAAVTDRGGNYIKGLRPADFRVFEDGVPQKLALFSEGGGLLMNLLEAGEVPANAQKPSDSKQVATPGQGSSVFILMDTSNYMYRNFAQAQDAIAEFIRTLDPQDSVAVYGFSRNLLRASSLTRDRLTAISGLRTTVAGDDTALYNSLLLTLQDARQQSGRKVVVVFSNGPDNGSMISPETVREYAESEGIPIYMISTQDATRDEISATVFRRITERTGGKSYFARNWRAQNDAFGSIREDLAHLYSLSYYPAVNANMGWRKVTVELSGENAKKYRIRTRGGYRPRRDSGLASGAGEAN